MDYISVSFFSCVYTFILLSAVKEKLVYCIFKDKDSTKLWEKKWEITETRRKEVLMDLPNETLADVSLV